MFNRLSYFFRNYFGFSRSETRGSIVLIMLMFVSIFVPSAIRLVLHEDISQTDLAIVDEPWLDSLSMALAGKMPEGEKRTNAGYDATEKRTETVPEKPVRLFSFDPNTATVAELTELGLPQWLAERIDKYRIKGGEFRVKDDLAKIYGMSDRQFATLRPYINLPEERATPEYAANKKKEAVDTLPVDKPDPAWRARKEAFAAVTFPYDINKADSIQLMALSGVGSKTSAKILKRREELGGFIDLAQLEEIWGISDEALDELESKTFVEKGFVPSPILINSASAEEIWQHPYLVRYQARALVNYRKQHGPFQSMADLTPVKVIDAETIAKLEPYLDFNKPDGEKSEGKGSNTTPGN